MKKIIGTLAVLALVGTGAFADVAVSTWCRSGMNLFDQTITKAGDDDSVTKKTVDTTPSWADGSRVGVSFSGTADDIGFNLDVNSNAGEIKVGDQAKVWANLGFLKFQFGRIQLDDLRGGIGDWGNLEAGQVAGQDDMFARFNPQKGMTVSMTPVDGLFIGAAIDTDDSKVSSADPTDVYGAAQVGIGYTIPKIAQLKVQYKGPKGSKDDTYDGFVQAGAKILAVDGQNIEVGVKFPTSTSDDNTSALMNAVVAATGSFDALTYKAHGLFSKAMNDKYSYATPEYALTKADKTALGYDGLDDDAKKTARTVTAESYMKYGADISIEYALDPVSLGVNGFFDMGSMKFSSKDMTFTDFGAEAYAKKSLSTGGYLFGGVGYISNSFKYDSTTSTSNQFYIPVGISF